MISRSSSAEALRINEEDFEQDPHALYDVLRVEAPVREVIAPGGLKVWLVTRYDDAKSALVDTRLSKNVVVGQKVIERNSTNADNVMVFATELSAHMLNTDPPDHTRLRKLVNKVFTMRAVEKLRPRIEEITTELLDEMEGHDQVDLMRAFAYPLPQGPGVLALCRGRHEGQIRVVQAGMDESRHAKTGMEPVDHGVVETTRSARSHARCVIISHP